jgi:DNA-binding Xre family transcriptional regulator
MDRLAAAQEAGGYREILGESADWKTKIKRRKHIGSTLDDLLAADGTLAEVETAAIKRVIAWQVERGMGERRISKTEMARAMRTSRAALDRLLDPKCESVTLRTVARAAKVLGKRLRFELA